MNNQRMKTILDKKLMIQLKNNQALMVQFKIN